MWNELNEQILFGNRNNGGVAPTRHEIARRAYLDKVRARQEAEQEAATTGKLFGLLSRITARTTALISAIGRARPVASLTRLAR